MYTKGEVLDFVKEEDVKFIRLAFFDLTGRQKNISIMANELPVAFSSGIAFDASSVRGFQGAEASDLLLHPDPSTLAVIPWRPSTGKVVRMFCDIKYPDGTPYEKDCRHILKQAVKAAQEECGVKMRFGSEIEFYLFKLNDEGEATKIPFDKAGYLDVAPEDKGENIRREICFTLEQMGITPESSHHEAGPGQNEIDFRCSDPLTSADDASTFKWIVRTKAEANGLRADFSPKPFDDKPGNGMHISVMCDACQSEDLSSKAGKSASSERKQIISSEESAAEDYSLFVAAGIMKHIEEITLFLNPTENSYRRIGEAKAPRYVAFAHENRSACVRTASANGKKRVEILSADPECNPYLAFSALIYSAIDGIKNKLEPPQPVSENLFKANEEITANLKKLPDTLEAARKLAWESGFVKECLGESVIGALWD